MLLHDFPEEQGHNVSHKVWRDLFLKAFHGRWGTIYWGTVLPGWLILDHANIEGVSQIHFSVMIFIFPAMKWYTLEDKALTKIMEIFILQVIS